MTGLHLDVGCYVADALDVEERHDFEAHLSDCDSCSREVVEFAETAAEMSRLVIIGPPPPPIRSSLLTAIRAVRPLPPLTEESTDPSPPVDELAARRRSGFDRGKGHPRRQRLLIGLVAAATVVALALGGWMFDLNQQQQTQLAQRAAAQRETELLSAPDTKVFTTERAGARYSFVVSRERNAAFFIGTDLADPGPGRAYQLWTLQGRRAVPDVTFGAAAGTQWFTGSVDQSTSLAVTVEPAGGSLQPTSSILAQVTF